MQPSSHFLRISGVVISTLPFKGCLENSDLESSDLQNTHLENSDLENSDLGNTDLEPQTSKTQYTFDENSRIWCLFSLQFLTTGVPTLLSSAVSCLSISIAGLATRTGNSQTVDLESMIA